MTSPSKSRLTWMALLTLSVAGFFLILYSTPYGGLGIDPDSVEYYAAAHSLNAGAGWLRFSGSPFSSWPPLYPVFLILAGKIGSVVHLTPIESMRWLHALVFGLIVPASGTLFLRAIRSRALALLATVAVLISLPLVQATVFLWSEAIFILMSLGIFLLLERYTQKPSFRLLGAAIILTALACLQRYMGVTIIAAGGLSILFLGQGTWLRRLRDGVVYGLLSVAPLLLWLVRNEAASGTAAGSRPASLVGIPATVSLTSDTILGWLIPFPRQSGLFPFGLLILTVVCVALVVYAARHPGRRYLAISATFVAVYPLMLAIFHSLIDLNPIGNRDLVPIYPFLIAVLFGLLDRAATGLTTRTRRPLAVYAVALPALIWLAIYPFQQTAHEVTAFRTWCCQASDWQTLDVVQWLDQNALHGVVLSNSTLPLYVAPMNDAYFVSISGGLVRFNSLAKPGDTLVWFDDARKKLCAPGGKYCHQTDFQLSDLLPRLEPVAALTDGGVYRVR